MEAEEDNEAGRAHQPSPPPRLGREEACGAQHSQMDADKLPPGEGLCAFRGWRDAMALEDVADRLITNGIAEILGGSDNAVIAPRAVLAGHPYHHILDLLGHTGAASRFARLSTLTPLDDERTVPGKDGIGLRNRGYLCQCLPA